MKYEAICHLQQFCFKYEREFSTMAKINFFRHKLEKRREQCVALCQQQLSINSKSSTHSSSSSSSSSRPPPAAFLRASLGQTSSQAPVFSNAVSLQYHPEKGRHGVTFWWFLGNLPKEGLIFNLIKGRLQNLLSGFFPLRGGTPPFR